MQRANGEQWEGVNVGLGLENILFILAFLKKVVA